MHAGSGCGAQAAGFRHETRDRPRRQSGSIHAPDPAATAQPGARRSAKEGQTSVAGGLSLAGQPASGKASRSAQAAGRLSGWVRASQPATTSIRRCSVRIGPGWTVTAPSLPFFCSFLTATRLLPSGLRHASSPPPVSSFLTAEQVKQGRDQPTTPRRLRLVQWNNPIQDWPRTSAPNLGVPDAARVIQTASPMANFISRSRNRFAL